MMRSPWVAAALTLSVAFVTPSLSQVEAQDSDASVNIRGHLGAWQPLTLTLDGPFANETDTDPNPFTELRFDVSFTHESGTPTYTVPGYFAADGNAAETSATSGTAWRAHLSPDIPGTWTYTVHFRRADETTGKLGDPVAPFDGRTGTFEIKEAQTDDLPPRDFAHHGRLQYVGTHHRQFAGDRSWFLKVGADAPETLLAYEGFDDTVTLRDWVPVKDYGPHVADWADCDPTWQDGKGKGLIGALNYLSAAGANGISFIPYNLGGDGRNVWPMVGPEKEHRLHYDASKLDQWAIVLDHAQRRGLHLNFKLQETENDDERLHPAEGGASDGLLQPVPEALDGGKLGPERRLYFREMIARFGHHLALTWNLGEENSQTPEEQRAMAEFFREVDPYDHHLVVQTFPHEQERKYRPLLGDQSELTGAALQNDWNKAHQQVLQWLRESAAAGKPWVVANDEQNHWTVGVPPDLGYVDPADGSAFEGKNKEGKPVGYDEHDVRRSTLWGALMAGGEGVEYYFGWELAQGDLFTEDWRSRANSWKFGKIALDFFHDHDIPFWSMKNRNDLVGNLTNANARYALGPRDADADADAPFVVFTHRGEDEIRLNLEQVAGTFEVRWFDPRVGGDLQQGSVPQVEGGQRVMLGLPPADPDQDWAILVRPANHE
ncbi:MAG: DUF5060 domain-containing protein [Planctomycetota bacterium]